MGRFLFPYDITSALLEAIDLVEAYNAKSALIVIDEHGSVESVILYEIEACSAIGEEETPSFPSGRGDSNIPPALWKQLRLFD